jgi:hypothetical protein
VISERLSRCAAGLELALDSMVLYHIQGLLVCFAAWHWNRAW